ncbi:MAG: hypothetical protein ACT4P3_13605 [Betaproteobacteria bacterium]
MQEIQGLVVANRILANGNVVDAYGHVSARVPGDAGRFLLSRSLAPELVEPGDGDGRLQRDRDTRAPEGPRRRHGGRDLHPARRAGTLRRKWFAVMNPRVPRA